MMNKQSNLRVGVVLLEGALGKAAQPALMSRMSAALKVRTASASSVSSFEG